MNTTITITAIICVTILIIVCIVVFVQYKLQNNDTLKDIKGELKEMPEELDTILQQKKEIKQKSDVQKIQNTPTDGTPTPTDDGCSIF